MSVEKVQSVEGRLQTFISEEGEKLSYIIRIDWIFQDFKDLIIFSNEIVL